MLALALTVFGVAASSTAGAQPLRGDRPVITVSLTGAVATLTEAIRLAAPGTRILVTAGTYREPMIVVDKPVEIIGVDRPVLDGAGTHQIMSIAADDVTIRGLGFRNVGTSFVEDRAAIRVTKARGCVIDDNRIDDAFFAIYLAGVADCRVTRNIIIGAHTTEAASGNGIHLWSSSDIVVENNRVTGHRDGIYLEFSRNAVVRGNISQGNLRYGLHFMYSDDCEYIDNTFRSNLAGVAVMYAKRVVMTDNRFEDNWGSASYGLLLKEISDPRIERNHFRRNTVGLLADGAVRIIATGNEFSGNGWAIKLMASTYDGRFERNEFLGNTFDMSSNSSASNNRLSGNYFDAYRGYDLNRDGVGDVPHRPVRLFSVLVEQNAPSVILLRSLFVDLLDAAERVLPVLTPAALLDEQPAMRRLAVGGRNR
jgi:nitrous oxidase accessory protein